MLKISCLLGLVASDDAEVDLSSAVPNSTKWIFDVEMDTEVDTKLVFHLLDARTKEVKTKAAIVAFSLVPLGLSSAGAALAVGCTELPNLALVAPPSVGRIKYRVTVDAVHSSVR